MVHELTLINPKGGTGKTTLAAAIAVWHAKRGLRVGLLDTDEQASLYQWAGRRQVLPAIHPTAAPLRDLARQLGSLRRGKGLDRIIIDTHGSLSGLEPAVSSASTILIPVQPSGADLLEIDRTLSYCARHRRPTLLIGNRIKTLRERDELLTVLTGMAAGRAKIAPIPIWDRVAHRSHFLEGMTAMDVGDKLAEAEIAALCQELETMT